MAPQHTISEQYMRRQVARRVDLIVTSEAFLLAVGTALICAFPAYLVLIMLGVAPMPGWLL